MSNPSPPSQSAILFVLSAPSGTGKTSAARALIRRMPELALSVSFTTRPRRGKEKEGRDYYFVTPRRFRAMAQRGDFAEWAEVHGRLYGTPRAELSARLDAGQSVVMDIDPVGARQIRKAFPKQSLLVMLLPPSWEALRRRIRKRADTSSAEAARRLDEASVMLHAWRYFDYLVVNKRLNHCTADLAAILRAETLRRTRRAFHVKKFLESEGIIDKKAMVK